MKLGKRICGVVTLVFLSSLGSAIFAQRQEITKREYDVMRRTGSELLSKQPFRIHFTEDTFKVKTDQTPSHTRSWVVEFILPGREHFATRDNKDRYERIRVEGTMYAKKGDAGWEKMPPPTAVRPPSPRKLGTSSHRYFALPNEKINGKYARRYLVEFNSKSILPDGKELTSHLVTNFWIGQDGRFLKSVTDREQSNLLFMREFRTYKYDPNIKIEAPPIK